MPSCCGPSRICWRLAGRFGTPAERAEIGARIDAMRAAQARCWDAARGLYLSRDLLSGAPIEVGTSAGLLPLFAGVPDAAQAAALAGTVLRWAGHVQHLVPSTDPADPAFEPGRYWRGPVWCVVNWMLMEGFAASGHTDLATRIRADTLGLIETAGFSEYFDPRTGAGIGGATFSWTAAVYLLMAPSPEGRGSRAHK